MLFWVINGKIDLLKIEIITPDLLPLKMRKNFRSLWCQHVFPLCPFNEKDKFGKKLSVSVIGEDGCKCCYYTGHFICIWAGKFYFFYDKNKKSDIFDNQDVVMFRFHLIGHFQDTFCLDVKMSPTAKPFIWKCVSPTGSFHANQTRSTCKYKKLM